MPLGSDPHNENAESPHELKRRRWLQILGIGGAAGLAGCGGGGGGTATSGGGDGDGDGDGGMTATPTPTEVGGGFGETDTDGPTTTQVEELPEVGGSYRSATSSGFETLNLIYNTEAGASGAIDYTLDGAYTFQPGQIRWPQWLELESDDNQVWVATLRDNLQWSDPYGQMTAEDYVYYITEVIQSEWAGHPNRGQWQTSDGNPIPVEQTGELEFQIELAAPDPLFPKKPPMWGRRTVPKAHIEKYVENEDQKGLDKDEAINNLEFTGNLGPYKLDQWQRQSRLVFTRNENYYLREVDGINRLFSNAPYFDKVEIRIIPEESARLNALKSGEIDTASIPPNKAKNYEQRDDIYLNVAPQPYNVPLVYNYRANGWEMFRRQGVRQALGCAVDKQRYVEGVWRGYANPQFTWQPQWSPWYDDEQVVKYGVGDLYGEEATKSRMRDALSDTDYGYQNGKLMNPQGEQVTLDLKYQAGDPPEQKTAQFVKQEFQQNAGIKVNIEGLNPTNFVRDYWQNQVPDNASELQWSNGPYNGGPRDKVTSKKSWDMCRVFGLNTYPMTPTTGRVFFIKDSTYNPYGYYPTYDFEGLFDEVEAAETRSRQKELLADIFGKISKDQPMGMLALNSEISGYRQGIVGPEEEFFNGWNSPIWYREG